MSKGALKTPGCKSSHHLPYAKTEALSMGKKDFHSAFRQVIFYKDLYQIVDDLQWEGKHHPLSHFRERVIQLDALPSLLQ